MPPRAEVLAALAEAENNRNRAAQLLGIHPATLFRALKAHRITAPSARRKYAPNDLALMRSLRQSGLSFGDIAKKFEASHDAVRYHCQRPILRRG